MVIGRKFSRRTLVQQAVVGLGGFGLLAACAPSAPTAKSAETSAASKPADASAAKPTQAPAAAVATSAPAQAAPTAAAKPAAKAAESNPGRQYIGKLEGPDVVADAPKPAKLGEAPMLAELVKAGKLPPVEQRVSEEPMVVKPLREIGQYGGTWRRAFTGPGDAENGNRIVSTDGILFWDSTGTKVVPSLARAWEISDGGRTITVSLRKGARWSDGAPFTANDFVFWWEDIYQNKDLVPTPTAELTINGKHGTFEKVDDYTIRWKFESPYSLFVQILASSTFVGRGLATRGNVYGGSYAPAHYLKQFLPKYNPEAEAQAKAAGFDSWVSYLNTKMIWARNPDLPLMTPWVTTTPINTPSWVLERNPYYWAVDPEGNQLPYIDKIQMSLAENLEVLNLRGIAGEYDWQERHVDLGKLPVYIENQQRGNYQIHLDPAAFGSDAAIQFNQTWDADPEIAKWLRNRDFRHAVALGIDRDQLNETFWLGVGTPGSIVPDDASLFSPGPEWRTKWATLDVNQANQLLDKIGLTQKDSEGFRQRTDGKGRLRIEMITVSGAFLPFTRIGEMIAQQLKKIGLQFDVVEVEQSLQERRRSTNDMQTALWGIDGSELILMFPLHAIPTRPDAIMGPLIGRWYASGGTQGVQPEDPQLLKALEMFRSTFGQDEAERIATTKEIWKILAEETFTVGTVGLSPAMMGVRIVKNTLGNVPEREMNAQHCRTPCTSHPPTVYFRS